LKENNIMRQLSLLVMVFITGCNAKPLSTINAAAITAAGSFIANYAGSSLHFRVKGTSSVTKESDSIFYVTGSAEGFSSYNVPFTISQFGETVRFSGGDVNDIKNWECLKMYVGKKRIK
jgi:hypothetical protein